MGANGHDFSAIVRKPSFATGHHLCHQVTRWVKAGWLTSSLFPVSEGHPCSTARALSPFRRCPPSGSGAARFIVFPLLPCQSPTLQVVQQQNQSPMILHMNCASHRPLHSRCDATIIVNHPEGRPAQEALLQDTTTGLPSWHTISHCYWDCIHC